MKKVLVGMSGGVDSSVAAALLKEEGYEVIGVTFKLFDPAELDLSAPSRCCSVDDVMDAKLVCGKLGIPHYVVNFKEVFHREVIDYFIETYRQGKTPNPCVVCNRTVKFGAFLEKADEWGADYIATGHYVQIIPSEDYSNLTLRAGKYSEKDQSYMLYTLNQSILQRCFFPLGEFSKEEVRQMAQNRGLLVAKKAESQDICFVPDGKYENFLEKYANIQPAKGDFLDQEGNVIGKHAGYFKYTIGQRKGLGMGFDRKLYVQKIDAENNQVVLGDMEDLQSDTVLVENVYWINPPISNEIRASVRLRYAQKAQLATLYIRKNLVTVKFDKLQKKGAPGQSAVFYDNDVVLGGGEIVS